MGLSFSVEASFKNIGSRKKVDIVQGDLLNPPFGSDSFDVVFSIGVLHHISHPE